MKVRITRRNCREASDDRKAFNNNEAEYYALAESCPLSKAIKRDFELDRVMLTPGQAIFWEDGKRKSAYLSNATKAAMTAIDSYTENQACKTGKVAVCNADALYKHLESEGLLELDINLPVED